MVPVAYNFASPGGHYSEACEKENMPALWDDSHLHTRLRENLKSHQENMQ
jgi:hypothetical protein